MTSARTELSSARRPSTAIIATAGIALAALIVFAGNYNVPSDENGGTSEGIATGILCLAVAALLFGLVVPRTRNGERTVLILAILTLLSLVVFWAGLTPILAAGTLAVANRTHASTRRTAILGTLAIAAAVLTVVWTLLNSHLT
jgi:hypothetical protein